MLLNFGRGARRLFKVSKETDYFLDNGACIQLITTDNKKKKFHKWDVITCFKFPKTKFMKLLKSGFIKKVASSAERLNYFIFTDKINDFKEEFV